jgi:NAD(P)-dependent dehydrogenase (short-subunit alcohol dehydrogenase family)
VADLLGDEAHAVAGEITKEGGSAVAVELDVTDPASVKGGVEIAESSPCVAQPEEVAAAVAFFASEQAGYITGQTLSVSGGLTMA